MYVKAEEALGLDVWGGIEKVGSKVVDVYKEGQQAKGEAAALKSYIAGQQQQAPSAGGTPSWLLPVAIGGGALVLVLLLKK